MNDRESSFALQDLILTVLKGDILEAFRLIRVRSYNRFIREVFWDGTPLLSHGVLSKNPHMVKMLIEEGAGINVDLSRHLWDHKPLAIACSHGNAQIASILIDAGADITANVEIRSMLHLACYAHAGALETAQVLLAHPRASDLIHAYDFSGKTPLSIAKSRNYPELVTLLETAGAKK